MDQTIARLRAKFAALPPSESATLGPALSEDDVAAFEQQYGMRLPEEFRRFVTRVGHDGYGPSYGLLPITRWVTGPARPGGTFPIRPDVDIPEPLMPGHRDPGDFYPGAIAVVYGGCSDYTLLVVAGPGRGRLVEVNAERHFAPYFHADAGFLSWYERWLDFVLSGYRDLTWFAHQMSGDEDALTRTLLTDAHATRRRAAAYTFITYPTPSRSLPATLAQALPVEPHPVVRETMVRALAAQGAPGRALLPGALADVSPDVRSLAVNLMASRTPEGRRLAPRLRRALEEHLSTEETDSVRFTIRYTLDHT